MTRIILDVDTGTDDAVAIMMAALAPEIELLACTTVWGNLDVEHTTENTLRVLDHIGAEVPVHRGRNRPIVPVPPGARAAHRTIAAITRSGWICRSRGPRRPRAMRPCRSWRWSVLRGSLSRWWPPDR